MAFLALETPQKLWSPRWAAGIAVLLAVLVWMRPSTARAAWIAGGNPVCVLPPDDNSLSALPDGSGGVYLIWTDLSSPTSYAPFVARVLADGTLAPGWPVNGVQATTGRDALLGVVEDGAGGLLLFWQHGLGLGLNAEGVNPDGTTRAVTGAPFASGGPVVVSPLFASTSAGGYYELCNNSGQGLTDSLFLHHFVGATVSAAVPVGRSPNFRAFVQLALNPDPAGGALTGEIVSLADPTGDSQIGHVQRTLADGSLGFSDSLLPNGNDGVNSVHAAIQKMSVVPDGSGGAFAAWRVGAPPAPALYMQHYLANGSTSWPTPTTAPVMDAAFRDGAGGVYLLGVPLTAGRLELHRRSGDVSIPAGWSGGRVVSAAGPFSSFAGVRSGTHVYVGWSAGGGAADDIFATAFAPDGSLPAGWSAGGNGVCNVAGQQSSIVMVAGTADDAYLAWIDRRSTSQDIYVARLMPSGPLVTAVPPSGIPLAFAAGPVRPNPADDAADFALTLPDATPATVEIADLQGRVVARADAAQHSGPQRVALPTSQLPNGLYFVRVRHGGHESSQRLSVFH